MSFVRSACQGRGLDPELLALDGDGLIELREQYAMCLESLLHIGRDRHQVGPWRGRALARSEGYVLVYLYRITHAGAASHRSTRIRVLYGCQLSQQEVELFG